MFGEENISRSLIFVIYCICGLNICYWFYQLIRIFLLKRSFFNVPVNLPFFLFVCLVHKSLFIHNNPAMLFVSFLTAVHTKTGTPSPAVINSTSLCTTGLS